MGWFRLHFDIGRSSVVVHAERREEAVEEVWRALEDWSRGAVEGLRLGSYVVSEETSLNLEDAPKPGFKLVALVCAPGSDRCRQPEGGHPTPQSSTCSKGGTTI